MRAITLLLLLTAAPLATAETGVATGPRPTTDAADTRKWTAGVAYTYDGSGNVRQIGNDVFVYDHANRLVEAAVSGTTRTYAYDAFGNRTGCTHAKGTPAESPCQAGVSIDPATNRVQGIVYDAAGNLKAVADDLYVYDGVSMITSSRSGSLTREYVYTADDERIATHTVGARWEWTVRDVTGKVLREFTSAGTADWTWTRDYVWRDGLLLASRQPSGSSTTTHRYHLDHLGSPRRITDDHDVTVGYHDYFAFGVEVPGSVPEPSPTRLRYTAHERDAPTTGPLGALDYMHARYYSAAWGRFLSLDPATDSAILQVPQSWNRYSYALNNPINITDPTGLYPCRYKLRGSDAETAGVPDGTVVDGECVEADADKTASEKVLAWVGEHETFVQMLADGSAGFADTVTLTGTKYLREYMGDEQAVNPCSGAYLGGKITGVAWWAAFGAAHSGSLANIKHVEFGQATVPSAQYVGTGMNAMSNAEKFQALGGMGGSAMSTLRGLLTKDWYSAFGYTLTHTAPTPGGMGALVGGASGGMNTIGNDC